MNNFTSQVCAVALLSIKLGLFAAGGPATTFSCCVVEATFQFEGPPASAKAFIRSILEALSSSSALATTAEEMVFILRGGDAASNSPQAPSSSISESLPITKKSKKTFNPILKNLKRFKRV